MNPDLQLPVIAEVDKMEKAGFIEPCIYTSWLSNIVVVRKKNGQIRVCVDFPKHVRRMTFLFPSQN
jgi:hypothetical protein